LDDALIASVKMLEFLSHQKKPISVLVDRFAKSSCYSGEINLPVKNSGKVIVELEKRYRRQGKITKLDGLTVESDDWWFNIRASNTELLMRLTMETKPDVKYMQQKKKEILSAIKRIDA